MEGYFMSIQITTAFVRQWERGITHLAEQKMSRFRDKVRMIRIGSGDRAYIDQLGSVTAQPYTTRHGDTPLVDTPHSRRQVTLTPYKHADLVDKADKIRTLNDPTNPYMVAFGRAFGRAIDDVIIASAFATASTGVDGSGTAAFDTNFQVSTTTGGMTIMKIAEANRLLREAENDPEDGFYLACSQDQIEDMLNDGTATSADYNSVRLLMTGQIDTFLGFTWVPTERLQLATGGERRCIAWAKNSLALAVGEEPSGRISERDDKNYSMQVFMSMDIGATRMDETGVVEILCVE
jgi:hypothetical protein